MTFRVALVLGGDLDELLGNAAMAVETAYGAFYDRDGDPANGAEFQVPWVRPDDVPVAAMAGDLGAVRTDAAVELHFDLRNTTDLAVSVVRRATEWAGERRWRDLATTGLVTDSDDVGWPRTYDLVVEFGGADDLVLDTIEVQGPVAKALVLTATPNPFNPRVTSRFGDPDDSRCSWPQGADLVTGHPGDRHGPRGLGWHRCFRSGGGQRCLYCPAHRWSKCCGATRFAGSLS